MSKQLTNALKLIFIGYSMIFLSSFAFLTKTNEWYPPLPPKTDYEIMFDNYKVMVQKKLCIPDYYYRKLGIVNPREIIQKPVVIQPEVQPIYNDGIPDWVLIGILKVESESYYTNNGDIVYVNKRRSRTGDIGPFQMNYITFCQIKKKSESFWKLEKDVDYAESITRRYLRWLYDNGANESWERAVAMYHTGPTGYRNNPSRGIKYLNKVKRAGN